MKPKTYLALLAAAALGFVAGAYTFVLAGYDTLQDTVQSEIREMKSRAVDGDEISARAFSALSEYIHAATGPKTVFFTKGMHIYDEGFWTL